MLTFVSEVVGPAGYSKNVRVTDTKCQLFGKEAGRIIWYLWDMTISVSLRAAAVFLNDVCLFDNYVRPTFDDELTQPNLTF